MNDVNLTDLFDQALDAAQHAYAPYSKFLVGAAIRTSSGKIYSGAYVENAAYPLGSCAEASAISAMIRGSDHEIADIAIISLQNNPCYPCGGCRQRIAEFSKRITRIHVIGADHNISSYNMDDLLPHAFGPHALNQDHRT